MKHLNRKLAIFLVLGCSAIALSETSLAQSLLRPSQQTIARAKSGDPTIKQQRLVAIDTSILSSAIHDTKNDNASDREGRSKALQGTVELELFAGQKVSLKRAGVEARPEGGIVWNGAGNGMDYASLAIHGGRITGVIGAGGRTFLLDPAGPGQHLLREIDLGRYAPDVHRKPPKGREGKAQQEQQGKAAASSTVTILFAHTSRAKAAMTAGGATVSQVLDRELAIVNRGMVNGGVPIVMKRVGIKEVSANYDENTADALDDISFGSNANFPDIRNTRNAVKADLVALYIKQNSTSYCGVAWVNQPRPAAAYGFGVVSAACTGSVTLAHELGHTMGLWHDRYVHSAAPASVYNYGYVSVTGNFRDIMSYPNRCYDQKGRDCPVRTYFSNPRKTINGQAAGVPKGSAGAADAARWLNEKRAVISSFR